MSVECPFSPKTADETIVRLSAFLTIVLMLTGLFSMLHWIALFLSFDFFIRGFTDLSISPVRRGARALSKIFRLKPKPINAGPKIFAARIGFIVCVLITILSFAGLKTPARIIAEILVLVAAMEAFFGFCVGCHLYSFFQRIKKAAQLKE